MLEDKVDLFIGSHDSATREANIATIKGKVPYIYSPVYEGGECSPNVYCLGETPPQQAQPAIEFLAKEKGAKTVLPDRRRLRLAAQVRTSRSKKYVAAVRRQGGRRGVRAVRRAQQVRGGGDAHQGAPSPTRCDPTLVGADNVNFNRTFAGFGLDKTIARLSMLLEENTLMGIGAESSANLFSCMGYYANSPSRGEQGVQGGVLRQVRRQGAAARDHRRRLLLGAQPRQGDGRQGRRGPTPRSCMAASEGLAFDTASGTVTMRGRQVDKDMYLASCKGTEFEVIKTIKAVKSGTACKV